MPAMVDQLFWIWPRRASISLWLSLAPVEGFVLPVEAGIEERLAPPPDASCLLSSEAIWSALKSLFWDEEDLAVSCFLPSFLSVGFAASVAFVSALAVSTGLAA